MAQSTHGGSRPGAGRPKLFQATKGNYLVLERETFGGETKWPACPRPPTGVEAIRPPELVKVLSVGENEIELQAGDDIIVLRFPDDNEIQLAPH